MIFFFYTLAITSSAYSTDNNSLGCQDIHPAYVCLSMKRSGSNFYCIGDHLAYRFIIHGLQRTKTGGTDVGADLKLEDLAGKTVLEKELPDSRLYVGQSGRSVFGFAEPLSGRIAPGDYKLIVRVVDRNTNKTGSFSRAIKILPAKLAVSTLCFFRDPDCRVMSSPVASPGDSLYFKYAIIGHDKSKRRIDLLCSIQYYDPDGNAMILTPDAKIITSDDSKVLEPNSVYVNTGAIWFPTQGKYRLEIKVTDRIAGTKAAFETTINVTDP